jgi:hypothetical protein
MLMYLFQKREKYDCDREIFWRDVSGTRHVLL